MQKIRRVVSLSIMLAASLLASTVALARPASQFVYAEVLDARPVVRTVRMPDHREVCWDERVHHVERTDRTGSTLLGGLIGGVIGNQFGSGSGRKAATAAGALIGGAIGSEQARERPDRHYSSTRERCRLERAWQEVDEVIGYDVDYLFDGDVFTTRTQRHPGNEIRLRVSVTPVE